METLKFPKDRVQTIIDHTRSAAYHKLTLQQRAEIFDTLDYQGDEKDRAAASSGLWLVGDDGVYLMSNGGPALLADGTLAEPGQGGHQFVCYAQGLDPKKDEDVWARKRAVFGGDDGVDYLPLDTIELGMTVPGDHLLIKLSPSEIEIVTPHRSGPPT